ncbi:MAG: DUF523 domain-containing protein [Desulfobacterales bacterium]|nr:DUF523 domain-containing protein [Desulfobacterales bacterium]
MQKILVSACLLGEKVRYDGLVVPVSKMMTDILRSTAVMIPFCPEVAGGLPVPRNPAEICGKDGFDVLDGKATVKNKSGDDVTLFYLNGAANALETAIKNNIKVAILKEKSPSCGNSLIYDGTCTKTLKSGKGVTAALFERNGIHVFNEQEIEKAIEFIG